MSLLVGPVTHVGAPFSAPLAELVVEQLVGSHLCYVFGDGFLDTEADVYVKPSEPVTHIVLWDPSWIREGPAERRLIKLRARYPDAVVVGVFSDWFAGWYGGRSVHRLGTRRALDFCNVAIIDRYGAAALRRWGWGGRINVLDHFLSYGRLPTIGPGLLDLAMLDLPRSYDVAFIGHNHAGFVWQRSYALEVVEEAALELGWTVRIAAGLSAAEMEAVLLDSKIVVNWQLGTQMNMRCYEAAACGCALVTNEPAPPGAYYAESAAGLVHGIEFLLTRPAQLRRAREAVRSWVENRSPEHTWQRIFDTALDDSPLS